VHLIKTENDLWFFYAVDPSILFTYNLRYMKLGNETLIKLRPTWTATSCSISHCKQIEEYFEDRQFLIM